MHQEHPKKKVDPVVQDDLTQRLKSSLKQTRPSRARVVAWALLLAAVGGVAVWWFFPRQDPPRLQVVAYDYLGARGTEAILQGALESLDAPANLKGREVFFVLPAKQVPILSGPSGEVSTPWTWPENLGETEFKLRLVGDKRRPGMDDHGRAYFYPPASMLCVVQVEDTLSPALPQTWQKENLIDIPVAVGVVDALAPLQKSGYRFVYLALGADRPLMYQKLRGWVRSKGANPGLPAGPVLGRLPSGPKERDAKPWEKAAGQLLRDYPDPKAPGHIAIAGAPDVAEQLHAAGFKTYYIGPAENLPATITRAPNWAALKKSFE